MKLLCQAQLYVIWKRLHSREIFREPEGAMLRINHNGDTDDVATGGQDILAVSIVRGLFAHHGLMEAECAVDALVAGFSDVFCGPRPVDALLSFAVAEECLAWKLVRKRVGDLHCEIVQPGAAS